MSAMANGV
jgi:hypothetical protein